MKVTIPIAPVSKKNSMQIIKLGNRYSLIPSQRYRNYEKECRPYLEGLCLSPINHPVTVKCDYYMPTKRRCDLTNLLEATHDVLTKWGVLADDCRDIVVSVDGSRVYYDKTNPRTEIEITDYIGEWEIWKKD